MHVAAQPARARDGPERDRALLARREVHEVLGGDGALEVERGEEREPPRSEHHTRPALLEARLEAELALDRTADAERQMVSARTGLKNATISRGCARGGHWYFAYDPPR